VKRRGILRYAQNDKAGKKGKRREGFFAALRMTNERGEE